MIEREAGSEKGIYFQGEEGSQQIQAILKRGAYCMKKVKLPELENWKAKANNAGHYQRKTDAGDAAIASAD